MSRTIKALLISVSALSLALLSGNVTYSDKGCKDLTGESGSFLKMITSGGIERSYMLYVPSKYKHNRRTPMVFNFHGGGGQAGGHFGYSELWAMADRYHFILVTPDGYGNYWNAGQCCGAASAEEVDDVGFVSDLIDEIMKDYCVDPYRIFATGFSNGGALSNRLACDLSDRIAAIAPIASWDSTNICIPSRPVPMIAFHGTDDLVVNYLGGLYAVTSWAARNGCSDETEIYYQKGDVTCEAYKGCAENATVVFCTIDGGGHNWPGALDLYAIDPVKYYYFGYTTQDIDASAAMWKFFAHHSMFGRRGPHR